MRNAILRADNGNDENHQVVSDDNVTTTGITTTTTATTDSSSSPLPSDKRRRQSTFHKRKLSERWPVQRETIPSDASSISCTTGQFDDADEDFFSSTSDVENLGKSSRVAASVHPVKRRRSKESSFPKSLTAVEVGSCAVAGMATQRSARPPSANRNRTDSVADKPSPLLACTATTSTALKATVHDSPAVPFRRSRFIEGSMNDRVSQRPPSFLFEEFQNAATSRTEEHAEIAKEERNAASATPVNPSLEHRHSGIFRFGKAIASAFNPFKSDIWKGSQDGAGGVGNIATKTQKEIMNERQALAQKAYAELKKTGFKGAQQKVPQSGALYSPGLVNIAQPSHSTGLEAHIADQTFSAIQTKMDYQYVTHKDSRSDESPRKLKFGAPATIPKMVDRSHTSSVPPALTPAPTPAKDGHGQKDGSIARLRSLYDLRKSNSALNLSSIKNVDSSSSAPLERHSAESHQVLRQQKSRKDLAKQAKLLKKVSNLEDKLEKARQELRGISGSEDLGTVTTSLCYDHVSSRQNFYKAPLPTLPSERLLQSVESNSEGEKNSKTNAKEEKLCLAAATATGPPVEAHSTSNRDQQQHTATKSQQGRKLLRSSKNASNRCESESKKRKPLVGPRHNHGDGHQSQSELTDPARAHTITTTVDSDRHTKSQKCNIGDSPGSIATRPTDQDPLQRQQQQEGEEMEPIDTKDGTTPTTRYSKSPNQRLAVLQKRSRPKLRSKSGSHNLRQAEDADSEMSDSEGVGVIQNASNRFYHQSNLSKHQLELRTPNIITVPPSPNTKVKKVVGLNDENVPPVPPVPQELLMSTMAPSLLHMRSGNLERIDETNSSDDASAQDTGKPVKNSTRGAVPDEFTWPEDIF